MRYVLDGSYNHFLSAALSAALAARYDGGEAVLTSRNDGGDVVCGYVVLWLRRMI